ncbi:zinc finger protein VAR3, chloroplastic-like [Papaver somniferum]|uniref:zinc finger protein VAR3, chloroplastic-like n=1 Tax=Papaver somniferum TaxID=3469 RepID=UPI000E6F5DDF|nr:zinc finger protein VAR3, chloroplastic-like [Papaver somniferum]
MASSRRLLSSIRSVSSSSSNSYLSDLLSSYTPTHFLSITHFTKPYTSTVSIDEFPETGVRKAVPGTHPWPEWSNFIEKLKNNGYFFNEDPLTGLADLSQLRYACLSFARDRLDAIKSLSREDTEIVVKYGCPSLDRKVVNAAKRLRAFVGLDEEDVCSGCNLRGSCDRANMKQEDSEASAHTADVMRMLLMYALDPLVHSSEKPNGREYVEASARRLLSELSEAPPDPSLTNSDVRPKRKSVNLNKSQYYQNIEMKKGDWMCSKCNFMNFARNILCLKCKEDGPKLVSHNSAEMKKGDWTCPKCEFMNFARKKICFRCQGLRSKRELQPGEWECPSCDFVNL